MTAFLSGVFAAALLAILAAVVLDTQVQQSTETAFSTRSARL